MAKSLRSKSKRSFRALKRTDEKSTFLQRDKARLERLNAKLTKGKDVAAEDEGEAKVEDAEAEPEAEMQVDEKKVSTSGPRESGRREWKAKKGIQPKRSDTTFNRRNNRRRVARDGRVKP